MRSVREIHNRRHSLCYRAIKIEERNKQEHMVNMSRNDTIKFRCYSS